MRQNLFAYLIGILIVTLISIFVVVTDSVCLGEGCRDIRFRRGLDLQGGLQLILQAEPRGDLPITESQLQAARDIIENRANDTGAAEPVVQTAGNNRILVELPGIENLEDATKIIQETAFLEFINGEVAPPSGCIGCEVDDLVLTENGGPRPEQLRSNTTAPTAVGVPTIVTSTTTVSGTITAPLASATTVAPVAQATPPTKLFKVVVNGDEIDGNKVTVSRDPTTNAPQVVFYLKGDGPRKLADFTSANIGKYMPIVLDKKVISNPTIQGVIAGGNGVITGLTLEEARRLSVQLKYGSLPVSLRTLESRKISATLGQEAIDKSIIAGAAGLGLVVLFMMTYYRLPGALASLALVIYSLIALAVFKLVPVTLTLAGIAGFILSIGMAVDANVLIFARLKEELRSGKTLGAAVEAGFDHAWPSIRDSNMSTLITCAILFWFGSTFGGASIIKGFALTLAIGVLVSLFSAITVSRSFLRAVVKTPLSGSRWAFNLDPKRLPGGTPAVDA
ncbi:MAG: protein translocase subunit SecD [Chloroflexia bacterium]